MLTLRQRIFVVSGIIIAIILAIIFIILWQKKARETVTTTDTTDVTEESVEELNKQALVGVTSEAIAGTTPKNVDPDELLAKQVSRIFVERFMTYSNQNDNKHVEDALKLATVEMESFIKSQSLEKSNDYQGVTTRVLSTSIREKEENKIIVGVSVQQELRSAKTSEMVQKKGRVELVKGINTWLVSGFFWE